MPSDHCSLFPFGFSLKGGDWYILIFIKVYKSSESRGIHEQFLLLFRINIKKLLYWHGCTILHASQFYDIVNNYSQFERDLQKNSVRTSKGFLDSWNCELCRYEIMTECEVSAEIHRFKAQNASQNILIFWAW